MKLHHKETCSLNLSVVLQTFPDQTFADQGLHLIDFFYVMLYV